ncbi:MAG: efflux RND transporter periplasmic adaptor subunit [Pseudomonadota bacterium]
MSVSLLATVESAVAQGQPAAVVTEVVERRSLAETLPVFGQIVASRDSEVAARVAGIVDEVAVLVGDTVVAGATLAVLDTELAQIELKQALAEIEEARAGIAIAEAQLRRAQDALDRAEGLRDTASFSSARFDDATSDRAAATGQINQAQARLLNAEAAEARARYTLERARITAPFEGVVLSVEADPGQFISVGAPVARLIDISALEVEAQVPAEFAPAIPDGVQVAGESDDGTALDLKVRAILPTESLSTRTRPVRLSGDFAVLGATLAVGQSITLMVPVSPPRDALSVPKDALVQGAQGWTVFVDAEGVAQPRPVRIGVAMGERFEVLDGLAEGDAVVVRGNERLRPGQALQAMAGGAPQQQSN